MVTALNVLNVFLPLTLSIWLVLLVSIGQLVRHLYHARETANMSFWYCMWLRTCAGCATILMMIIVFTSAGFEWVQDHCVLTNAFFCDSLLAYAIWSCFAMR